MTPLHGKAPPPPPEPGGRPAAEGPPPLTGAVWPAKDPEPGYGRGTHGATSQEGRRQMDATARAMETALLEDPEMPDHVRSPAFRGALRDMCRANALNERIWEWLCLVEEEGGIQALMMPPMPGTRPPVETAMSAQARAAMHRGKMGLDPASYARLAKDLGIAGRAAEDGLQRLARQGGEIIDRRQELEPGPWPADEDQLQ